MNIDTTFDFTTDTKGFWDGFWERSDLGVGGNDPDSKSKTLQCYHQKLWSRALPNGEKMELSTGKGSDYLVWNSFRFGSDSITTSFRYERNRKLLEEVERDVPNYRGFVEDYLRKAYRIGGAIIFPKRRYGSINQSRGCNPLVRDRWDLSLECIRRFYTGEKSPLDDVLLREKPFFDLFMDFSGYVDFFLLQDCVSSDYKRVNIWLGDALFDSDPIPKTKEEYLYWIEKSLEFVEKRNRRIKELIAKTV